MLKNLKKPIAEAAISKNNRQKATLEAAIARLQNRINFLENHNLRLTQSLQVEEAQNKGLEAMLNEVFAPFRHAETPDFAPQIAATPAPVVIHKGMMELCKIDDAHFKSSFEAENLAAKARVWYPEMEFRVVQCTLHHNKKAPKVGYGINRYKKEKE